MKVQYALYKTRFVAPSIFVELCELDKRKKAQRESREAEQK